MSFLHDFWCEGCGLPLPTEDSGANWKPCPMCGESLVFPVRNTDPVRPYSKPVETQETPIEGRLEACSVPVQEEARKRSKHRPIKRKPQGVVRRP